jgi:effector-binding domain-containing protein
MGSYERLGDAYKAIETWMQEHHTEARVDTPMWEEYFSPPGTPPGLTRTDVYWPVRTVQAG